MSDAIDPKRSVQEFYAVQLCRERTKAGMSQSDLASRPELYVSNKLIGHVENCRRPPTARLSKALDKVFGLTEYFEGLYELFVKDSGIPSSFWEYSEQETLASSFRVYNHFVITGLLQTEEYAREILRAGQRADKLDQLVDARMARQEILRREEPPWLLVVLDELVLRRVVGGPEVMKRQLEHLLDAMREPNITIVIVPADAPVYPGGAFTLLGFSEAPTLAYVESVGGHGRIIEPGPKVNDLAVLFDRLTSVALPLTESEKFIRALLESM